LRGFTVVELESDRDSEEPFANSDHHPR
jgi:hypothetical protein